MQNTKLELNLPSPLQELHDEVIEKAGIRLFIKRDDLIHPTVSGNKWRKLKYNIQAFQNGGFKTIVTFGGAFSNHIHATAAIGKELNIPTVGIIRGEEHLSLNNTLKDATEWGMTLKYIDRTSYRSKNSEEFIASLNNEFDKPFIIPEGGANTLGVKGCEEITSEITIPFDSIYCACGTATTLSGILNSLQPNQKAYGVPVLKGGTFLHEEIKTHSSNKNCTLLTDYHFKGYAKHTPELMHFISNFKKTHNIELEHVYTGKLFFAIYDQLKKGLVKKGDALIAIHTGGIQGLRGL